MKPLRKIESPCKIDWQSMKVTSEPDRRFCEICNKSVFNVTSKNDKEIESLLRKNNNDICVRSLSYQLADQEIKKRRLKQVWKKGKFIAIFLMASFISQDLSAQQKRKIPDSYHIIQHNLDSDTITVTGIIKAEKFIGWRKLKNASINIWSEENINLGNFQTERNGKFKFTIDKKLIGGKFSISFSALDYKRIKIENLDPQNTKIEVYLEERKTEFVTGRYF